MVLSVRGLVFFLLVFCLVFLFDQIYQPVFAQMDQSGLKDINEAQNRRSQADQLEDKGAQAIDDGDMARGLDFMVQAIALDPTPERHMNYGSILFGNGVSVYKDSDQEKGKEILRQAQAQLQKAIEAFNSNKDQVYLSQCYFLLGEMYNNAFGDKLKAKEYYTKAASLNDYMGARDALNKL